MYFNFLLCLCPSPPPPFLSLFSSLSRHHRHPLSPFIHRRFQRLPDFFLFFSPIFLCLWDWLCVQLIYSKGKLHHLYSNKQPHVCTLCFDLVKNIMFVKLFGSFFSFFCWGVRGVNFPPWVDHSIMFNVDPNGHTVSCICACFSEWHHLNWPVLAATVSKPSIQTYHYRLCSTVHFFFLVHRKRTPLRYGDCRRFVV